jgi:hypothetical protein
MTMTIAREGEAAVLVRREDYARPPYLIRSAELTFDLDPAKTLVASRLRIERDPSAAPGQPLRLHGEDLTLLRVLADGQSVSFRHEGGMLVIDQPPAAEAFTLEIRNTCAPDKNTHLSGLYTSGGGCVHYFTYVSAGACCFGEGSIISTASCCTRWKSARCEESSNCFCRNVRSPSSQGQPINGNSLSSRKCTESDDTRLDTSSNCGTTICG